MYTVYGVEASPYSVKLRAILRYRRIPHRWAVAMPGFTPGFEDVRPPLMPVLEYPDGTRRTDSTPLALDLEEREPVGRSILPDDPALAFRALLIEDMADEWLTKCLFHYRFSNEADGWFAARWVMSDALGANVNDAAVAAFRERQISRMPLVGCTPENAPLIEASYKRVLAILEANIARDGYLFGTRPSIADFALYGQLKTLGTDPTPMAIMREMAPAVDAWVRRMDDPSGVEGQWRGLDDISPAVIALTEMAGEIYLPFLRANASAIDDGKERFTVCIAETDFSQNVFRYQSKCLSLLRQRFGALSGEDKGAVRKLTTGFETPI